jgi:hypothetical protein
MRVELSEQDIRNTIGFLTSPALSVPGNLTIAHVVLVQTYQAFLQPTPPPDGARPAEEIPTEAPTEEPTT